MLNRVSDQHSLVWSTPASIPQLLTFEAFVAGLRQLQLWILGGRPRTNMLWTGSFLAGLTLVTLNGAPQPGPGAICCTLMQFLELHQLCWARCQAVS